jgi:imidazolonepropionase-like amidohydrolase
MSTMQAIQAATGWAAECVGLDKDIGTISTDKFADLVVLSGNPLDDISIIQDPDKIKMVIKGGEIFVDRSTK